MVSVSARTVPTASLPIIDIAGLLSAKRADQDAVAAAIRAACLDKGFFYIKGHGVPAALIDAVFREARTFFALPPADKLAISRERSQCSRGYEPFGFQTLDPGTAPDVKEAFDVGFDWAADDPRVTAYPQSHGPNQWPASPEFRRVMSDYFAVMLDLTRQVLNGLGRSLDLADDFFAPLCHDPVVLLRLLHYPEQPAEPMPGEMGAGAHTDWGAATLLLQDDNAGLQVWDGAAGWIHMPPVPGTYVVNLGDLMARWTNDQYRSTLHRVVNISGRDRYSVPFFFDGNPDYVVSCLPSCSGPGDPPKYPPVTTVNHVREKQMAAELR